MARTPARARTRAVARPRAPARARSGAKSAAGASSGDRKARRGTGVSDRAALAREVARCLAAAIPSPRCELRHRDAWELVVATILSAQCTDQRVNAVTPALFRRWRTPRALAAAALEDVEAVVRPTGFYRNKAKAIVATARKVAEDFAGSVPRTIEEMLTLPGVARKTANVVLGTAYGIPTGIVVDTHVGRVARRLGLTESDDPSAVESELCALFPRKEWIATGHRLLLHGRYVCIARAPQCAACPLAEVCPSRLEPPAGPWKERVAAERGLVEAATDR